MATSRGDSSAEGGTSMIKSDAQRERTLAQIEGFGEHSRRRSRRSQANAPPRSSEATRA